MADLRRAPPGLDHREPAVLPAQQGANNSASPVYPEFVDKAVRSARFGAALITPLRWLSKMGGHTKAWLHRHKVTRIEMWLDSRDVFPGLTIAGGVGVTTFDLDASASPSPSQGLDDRLQEVIVRTQQGAAVERGWRRLFRDGNIAVKLAMADSILDHLATAATPTATLAAIGAVGRVFKVVDSAEATDDTPLFLDKRRLVFGEWTGNPPSQDHPTHASRWRAGMSRIVADYGLLPSSSGRWKVLGRPVVAGPGVEVGNGYMCFPTADERSALWLTRYLTHSTTRLLVFAATFGTSVVPRNFTYVPNPLDRAGRAPEESPSEWWLDRVPEDLIEGCGEFIQPMTAQAEVFADRPTRPTTTP